MAARRHETPKGFRALGNFAHRGDTMKASVIWTVVFVSIVVGGISAGYAIADHDPSNFLRTFGCSLSK